MRIQTSIRFICYRDCSFSYRWRHIFSVFILAVAFATVGCGNRIGQDAEVSEKNEKLAALVKVALVQESGVNAAPIDIKVQNSIVTLGGFVEKEPQRQAAEMAARRVRGVKSVINTIQIK